jgi:hypothetical protein
MVQFRNCQSHPRTAFDASDDYRMTGDELGRLQGAMQQAEVDTNDTVVF